SNDRNFEQGRRHRHNNDYTNVSGRRTFNQDERQDEIYRRADTPSIERNFRTRAFRPNPPIIERMPSMERSQSRERRFPVNSVGGSRKRRMSRSLTPLLFLAALIALVTPVQAKEYQLCTGLHGGLFMEPPRAVSCQYGNKTNEIRKTKVELITRNNTFLEWEAWKCYKEVYSIHIHDVIYIREESIEYSHKENVSLAECQYAVTERNWDKKALTRKQPGLFASEDPISKAGRSIWNQACERFEQFYLQKGVMTNVQDGLVMSNLFANTDGCKKEEK
ncbi:unnamed protein product, partial [Auanema sp. JU1783]